MQKFQWKINVIDTDGHIEGKMVTSKDVWKLQNSKVIVHFDEDSGQPIGDSGGLLGSWLGQLSNDVNLIPINYSDWRLVSPHIKERAWEVVQSKFRFDDPMLRKDYVMGALGSRCKDVKLRLWREYKRETQIETVQNRPDIVPEDQWRHLVHMRNCTSGIRTTKKTIPCLTYVEERVFQGEEMRLKSKPEKHHVEQSFSSRLVRNLMEVLSVRRPKHDRKHLRC
uniref:Uncharacterized protein n=1 Tax=Noccaea caerulescens TaxID=107243 RepID=A0A1J3GQQ8_NOCCA